MEDHGTISLTELCAQNAERILARLLETLREKGGARYREIPVEVLQRRIQRLIDSFWQGVDAPGEALRLLIICRLPFQVPNDPVIEARYERIIERTGNPFIELSLPEAVTRLRQGFGRLMRRATDRGVVLILDSRILKKQYGSAFIDSLPEAKRCFSTKDAIMREMERLLYEN